MIAWACICTVVGQTPEVRLAKAKTDANFTSSCGASILYPTTGGNIHCFTAVTACVVLDVLGPPYSDSEGRHCTYYNVFPYENFSGMYVQMFNIISFKI